MLVKALLNGVCLSEKRSRYDLASYSGLKNMGRPGYKAIHLNIILMMGANSVTQYVFPISQYLA